jgi:hypothetical protein
VEQAQGGEGEPPPSMPAPKLDAGSRPASPEAGGALIRQASALPRRGEAPR